MGHGSRVMGHSQNPHWNQAKNDVLMIDNCPYLVYLLQTCFVRMVALVSRTMVVLGHQLEGQRQTKVLLLNLIQPNLENGLSTVLEKQQTVGDINFTLKSPCSRHPL